MGMVLPARPLSRGRGAPRVPVAPVDSALVVPVEAERPHRDADQERPRNPRPEVIGNPAPVGCAVVTAGGVDQEMPQGEQASPASLRSATQPSTGPRPR